MTTNPVVGFLKTIILFICGRIVFIKQDQNRQIIMEDGMRFRVFRHVKVRTKNSAEPKGVFVVRFRPRGMTVQQNIRFSLLPMMIFMGFRGFREKYWCVNDETGLCQGVYAWQTMDDAQNYSQSIAMRFMTNRSYPNSVQCQVLNQEQDLSWLFAESNAKGSQLNGESPCSLRTSRYP
jgi:hypothetical protein